jgi:hypothetical protein
MRQPGVDGGELRVHVVEFVGLSPEALVLTGGKGALLRSGNFLRAVDWPGARVEAGLPARASTKELMHRMGHSSI